jgi:hypothetical protein
MASKIFPILKRFVDTEWVKLDANQITPWAFFNSHQGININDFYGGAICYRGIEFSASARDRFWTRYLEPFLEDITDRAMTEVLTLARDRGLHAAEALGEMAGLLYSMTGKAFGRMIEIDRRLRGNGYPESVDTKSAEREILAMRNHIAERLRVELEVLPKRLDLNRLYKENPGRFWLIGILIGGAFALSRFL